MIPQGKGVFIWKLVQAAGGDPSKMADMAARAGFSWVTIKAADGVYNFNQGDTTWGGPNLLGKAVEALRARGIKVYGWQYVYGATRDLVPIAKVEAKVAADNINRFDLDGWFIDAEAEYKRVGSAAWADVYMTTLRSNAPSASLGLCSYRFPSLHPEIPWLTFLKLCDFHAPQVYWIKATNPGKQLEYSVIALRVFKDIPIVPVGVAYYDPGYQWKPTVAQLDEFNATARKLDLPGITWWEWGENGTGMEYIPEFWQAISAHDWGAEPVITPPVEPPAIPDVVRIKAGLLNVRSGPGVNYGVIGTVPSGLTLFVTDKRTYTESNYWYECGSGWVAGWWCEVV